MMEMSLNDGQLVINKRRKRRSRKKRSDVEDIDSEQQLDTTTTETSDTDYGEERARHLVSKPTWQELNLDAVKNHEHDHEDADDEDGGKTPIPGSQQKVGLLQQFLQKQVKLSSKRKPVVTLKESESEKEENEKRKIVVTPPTFENEENKEKEILRDHLSTSPRRRRRNSSLKKATNGRDRLCASTPVYLEPPSSDTEYGYSSEVERQIKKQTWQEVAQDCLKNKGSMAHPEPLLSWVQWVFGWLLSPKTPNWLSVFLNFILVTPYTVLTPLSLHYQLYLNEIFHTTFLARSAHFILMPCITWSTLTMAAYFECDFLEDSVKHPIGFINGREIDLFARNGAFYLAVAYLIWWIIWGFLTKTYSFGFFVMPNLFVLYITANLFHYWTRYEEGGTWYAPAPLYANPFVLAGIFSFLQAASHYQEPLPPRVNLSDHWIPLHEWLASRMKNGSLSTGILLIVFQFMTGTVNEFLAGPRLFPLLVLKQMHMLGYKSDQWKHLMQLTKWARRFNDPALDYIGQGGALPAAEQEAPPDATAAKEELRELHGKMDAQSVARRHFLLELLCKNRLYQLSLRRMTPDMMTCIQLVQSDVEKVETHRIKLRSSGVIELPPTKRRRRSFKGE